MIDEIERRRRVRRSTLLLLALAFAVYGGFILMAVIRSR